MGMSKIFACGTQKDSYIKFQVCAIRGHKKYYCRLVLLNRMFQVEKYKLYSIFRKRGQSMVGLPGVSSCVAWTKTVTNNAKTHHGIDLPNF